MGNGNFSISCGSFPGKIGLKKATIGAFMGHLADIPAQLRIGDVLLCCFFKSRGASLTPSGLTYSADGCPQGVDLCDDDIARFEAIAFGSQL